MSSAVSIFVHAIRKRLKKCLMQKVAHFGSPGWIPMIQIPFSSSCVALQYETGTRFLHLAVLEFKNQYNHVVFLSFSFFSPGYFC